MTVRQPAHEHGGNAGTMRMVAPMAERDPRFFLCIPPSYFFMTEDEQAAAAQEMWADAMGQTRREDKFDGDRDEHPDEPGS